MKAFKKIMSTAVATALFLISMNGISVNADSTVCGDVDCDGACGLSDLVVLNKFLNGYVDLANLDNADVNANGVISGADYSILLDYALGDLKELPYKGN